MAGQGLKTVWMLRNKSKKIIHFFFSKEVPKMFQNIVRFVRPPPSFKRKLRVLLRTKICYAYIFDPYFLFWKTVSRCKYLYLCMLSKQGSTCKLVCNDRLSKPAIVSYVYFSVEIRPSFAPVIGFFVKDCFPYLPLRVSSLDCVPHRFIVEDLGVAIVLCWQSHWNFHSLKRIMATY